MDFLLQLHGSGFGAVAACVRSVSPQVVGEEYAAPACGPSLRRRPAKEVDGGQDASSLTISINLVTIVLGCVYGDL